MVYYYNSILGNVCPEEGGGVDQRYDNFDSSSCKHILYDISLIKANTKTCSKWALYAEPITESWTGIGESFSLVSIFVKDSLLTVIIMIASTTINFVKMEFKGHMYRITEWLQIPVTLIYPSPEF